MASPKNIDITGNVYSMLTAIKFLRRDKVKSCDVWLFKCECGVECEKYLPNVKNNKIKSCGCLRVNKGKKPWLLAAGVGN